LSNQFKELGASTSELLSRQPNNDPGRGSSGFGYQMACISVVRQAGIASFSCSDGLAGIEESRQPIAFISAFRRPFDYYSHSYSLLTSLGDGHKQPPVGQSHSDEPDTN
jgi:hypothetical protein